MNWLDKESLEKWFNLLPEDVASCMDVSDVKPQENASQLTKDLAELKSGQEILSYVISNADDFASFGRLKRIRFLAWLAARDYPDTIRAIQIITGEDGDEGVVSGTEKIAPLFMSDLKALVESLGPRAANLMVDGSTLGIVRGAGFEVADEFEMKSGGGL